MFGSVTLLLTIVGGGTLIAIAAINRSEDFCSQAMVIHELSHQSYDPEVAADAGFARRVAKSYEELAARSPEAVKDNAYQVAGLMREIEREDLYRLGREEILSRESTKDGYASLELLRSFAIDRCGIDVAPPPPGHDSTGENHDHDHVTPER